MTIYLYKKTHNQTGLQYLGKTVKDPFKYKGSGKYWLNHIKKYGYDVTTEIIQECKTTEEVKEWGIYYSRQWNVVERDDWANLKEETGDGGFVPGKPAWNKGKKCPQIGDANRGKRGWVTSEEQKKKKSLQMKGKKYPPERCMAMGISKRKKVEIDNKIYSSRKEAALILKIPESTVGFRIKSASFPDWKYV